MSSTTRRLLVLALAAVLVLGGCSSKKKSVALNAGTSDSTTTTAAVGGAQAAAGVSGGGVSASGAAGASATTTKPAGSSATTAKPAGAASGSGSSSQAYTGVGAKPGTYTYALSGTGPAGPVSGNQNTVVDPANGQDQKATSQDGNGGSGETLYHFQSDGVYLKDLKIGGGANKEFVFNPPVLALAQPSTAGKTWQWGPVSSTDGRTTVSASFKIIGPDTIAVGSEQVACVHLQATISTKGDIVSTATQDVWSSTKYQVIAQEHDVTDVTVPFVIHTDITRKLGSTSPK